MSGSTMLMAVSSSGAVTITGEISGSDAANALLLSGTGSVGFTTTSSFLAVSSSQQEVSASYISLSGSYNTFSGSASTRITENSSSIQQVSASQQQISASLLNVISIFATTGSNSFRANQSITGSLVVSSTITAQTLVVQTVTSSIIYSSGSNVFGCDLNSRQTFTGSIYQTGSLVAFASCVGIGTITPSTLVQAYSTAVATQISIDGTGRYKYFETYASGTRKFRVGWDNTNVQAEVWADANAPILFATNDIEKMRITSGGNVLVGSSSNDFGKLDITVAPSSYTAALGLGLQTNSGEGNSVGISFKTKVSLSGVIWENARIAAFTDSISLSAYGALAFYTMNATTLSERMRIASDGNVGIKCTSPGVSLVVGTTDALKLPTGTTAQRPSGASGLIRMNSTTGQPEWYDSVSTSWVSFASQIGTCTYDVQYLVVGGGGGGGQDRAGAGGAGGYRLACTTLVSGTSYYAIIGAGGGSNSYGTQGGRSAFNAIVSIGGGAGGSGNNTYSGTDGGSGGGGGNSGGGCSNAGGAGTTGQGNAGGSGVYVAPNYGAGGGGGAGAVGANGTSTVSGNGGDGCQNSICGVSRYYAGGGGAGAYGGGTLGLGGAGGGGNGTVNAAGCAGAANSGGGGGSEGSNSGGGGGAGGSGIVIIRYCGSQRGTGGTVVSCNGHTIHIFSSSTMYTA